MICCVCRRGRARALVDNLNSMTFVPRRRIRVRPFRFSPSIVRASTAVVTSMQLNFEKKPIKRAVLHRVLNFISIHSVASSGWSQDGPRDLPASDYDRDVTVTPFDSRGTELGVSGCAAQRVS